MAREPKCRRVTALPRFTVFKPVGTARSKLKEIVIKIEELEAIRLKDLLGLEQEDCANSMRVSRPTFQRILVEGRRKMAEALTEGKVIRLEGGDYCLGQEQCRRSQKLRQKTNACLYLQTKAQDPNTEPIRAGNIIAVCADADSASASVDGRFGRCACFLLWDKDEHKFEPLINKGPDLKQGAGTGAVLELLRRGVGTLVCNRIGLNALAVFKQAGGTIYQAPQGMPIDNVLNDLQAGKLKTIERPNHEGED